MTALALVLPGDPDTRTGGYIYDRRIAAELATRGWQVRLVCLSPRFPHPDAAALAHAESALAALDDGTVVLADGLALGAMPEPAHRHAPRLHLVALVHHPLALEGALNAATAVRLEDSERRALAAVRQVVVTSASTAAILAERYGVDPGCISVAEPGTDPAPTARGSGGAVPHLLCVASLTPRKGHDVLLGALARLRHLDWRLTCVGSARHSPSTAAALHARVRETGLDDRVTFAGEADDADLARHYERADAFVLPTRLEGYGMALAEAVARGLPVVTSAGGAAAATVGDEAALLVPVDDVDALAGALTRLIDDGALRQRLARGARRRAAALPRWHDTAAVIHGALCRAATP